MKKSKFALHSLWYSLGLSLILVNGLASSISYGQDKGGQEQEKAHQLASDTVAPDTKLHAVDEDAAIPIPIPKISDRCLLKQNNPELESPIFFDFMGKSIHGSWDIGVMRAALEDIPQMSKGNVQLGGNSSGALMAAYFACWGVNQKTVTEIKTIMKEFDYSLIPTNEKSKMVRLFMKAVPTENDPTEIKAVILEKILSRGEEKCDPAMAPLIISAANRDVIDRRVFEDRNGNPSEGPSVYRNEGPKLVHVGSVVKDGEKVKAVGESERVYDPNTKMVYQEIKIYSEEGHELLETRRQEVGKTCTYFVTQVMLDKLEQVPYEQRECELRLIETREDLHLAIMASIAEPTFFDEQKETNFRKIAGSGLKSSFHKNRAYIGGYLNSVLAADLKKVEPNTYVIGTGVTPFSKKIESLLSRWFLVSPNERLAEGKKSLDFEVLPTVDWSSTNTPDPKELVEEGYKKAKEMFAAHAGRCSGFQPKKPNGGLDFDSFPKSK